MIERDYLELKQEVGLGHFEGRGWRGFHRAVPAVANATPTEYFAYNIVELKR